MMLKFSDIRGAIARGYCHRVNETKVLDGDLCEAMAEEVWKHLYAVCYPERIFTSKTMKRLKK